MNGDTHIPLLAATADVLAARRRWRYTGAERPDFAIEPAAGQESVWDYPRPPAVEPYAGTIEVFAGRTLVARTAGAVRVLETAGAPTFYCPPTDVHADLLDYGEATSICEWKGLAQTLHVAGIADAGWRYVKMFEPYTRLYGWPSFYPGKLACYVDGERARPQPGRFYGGWVTAAITGPIKGEPGSAGW